MSEIDIAEKNKLLSSGGANTPQSSDAYTDSTLGNYEDNIHVISIDTENVAKSSSPNYSDDFQQQQQQQQQQQAMVIQQQPIFHQSFVSPPLCVNSISINPFNAAVVLAIPIPFLQSFVRYRYTPESYTADPIVYSNNHPSYRNLPSPFLDPSVIPDLSVITPDNGDDLSNLIKKTSFCGVVGYVLKHNIGLVICTFIWLLLVTPLVYLSLTNTKQEDLNIFILCLVVFYFFYFFCVFIRKCFLSVRNVCRSSPLRVKDTSKRNEFLYESIVSPTKFVYPAGVEEHLSKVLAATPSLFVDLVTTARDYRNYHRQNRRDGHNHEPQWIKIFHSMRNIPLISYRDISVSYVDFLQQLELSGTTFFKIKYEYEYLLTPGQQKLLDILRNNHHVEECWRGERTTTGVIYSPYGVSEEDTLPYQYVRAYKESQIKHVLRCIFFNQFFELITITTVILAIPYLILYKWAIPQYTFVDRKYLTVSSQRSTMGDQIFTNNG